MKFEPRLKAPAYNDKHWMHTSKGGYNSCILIKGSSVLPNCVGYAWGRIYELKGSKPKLSRGNAENWYNFNDGYPRGNKPKLGAVICWRKGQAGNETDGAGHVAVVEEVKADGTIVISNSAYNGTRFYIKTLKPPYYIGSKYTLQGFIYPVDFEEEVKPADPTPTPIYKFNIGDKVVINGNLYVSSNDDTPSGSVTNKITTITRRANGSKNPYNTTGDMGWMREESIQSYVEPKPTQTLHVGDNVEIIDTGNASSWGRLGKAYGIGYKRFIKRIWVGRPFPYQVGNEKGTTGFYTEKAIKKI